MSIRKSYSVGFCTRRLGLAHALGKPVIIVTGDPEDIPFDIHHLRHIAYDKNDENWGATLRTQIRQALEQAHADPRTGISIFLRPIPSSSALSERQRAIVGKWAGRGQDVYVEKERELIEMDIVFEFYLNNSQIVGTMDVSPNNSSIEPVSLSFNGEFYNDDILN